MHVPWSTSTKFPLERQPPREISGKDTCAPSSTANIIKLFSKTVVCICFPIPSLRKFLLTCIFSSFELFATDSWSPANKNSSYDFPASQQCERDMPSVEAILCILIFTWSSAVQYRTQHSLEVPVAARSHASRVHTTERASNQCSTVCCIVKPWCLYMECIFSLQYFHLHNGLTEI